MVEPGPTVLDWMSGTGYRLVLLVGLLSATLVGWHAWHRLRTPAARSLWLGAVSVLACLALWLLFGTAARFAGLEQRLWAAPLDRLLGVAVLVALGWTLSTPDLEARRWRGFLALGLSAATLAYLAWAPQWAEAFQSDPSLSYDATGLARAWDAWQLILAVAVGIALLHGRRSPRWLLGVVGGLALGALLELVMPLSATVPAWSRLGTLFAGAVIIGAAVSQAHALRPPGLDLRWPLPPVRPVRRRGPVNPPGPAGSTAQALDQVPATPTAPSIDLSPVMAELAHQATVIGTLTDTVSNLAERLRQVEGHLAPVPGSPTPAATAETPRTETGQALVGARVGSDGVTEAITVADVAKIESEHMARRIAAPEGDLGPADLSMTTQRYALVLERLPWGVLVTDADDRVAFANAAAAARLHLRQIEPGHLAAELFPECDKAGYALHRARKLQDPGGSFDIHFESPALRVTLAPLGDPLLGYLGTMLILQTPGGNSKDLTGDLVPELAGSLRQPLTSILGYTDLIGRMENLGEDQVQRYVQRIDANLGRLRVYLANLLTAVELAGDPPEGVPEPVVVEDAVHAALRRAQPQFDEKSLVPKFTAGDPLPPASAQPEVLAQILDNLLAHVAFRSPQGGDVTLHAALAVEPRQRALILTVGDRGRPLAAGATGPLEIDAGPEAEVALTVVRILAERLGGRAWAEGDPQGARFHVRLPIIRHA